MNSPLILADGDWLRLLVPLIGFGIYAFNRWMTAQKARGPAGQRRQPAPRPQAAEAPKPAKPAPRPANTLSNEIDQFLKEAAQRKRAQKRPGASSASATQTSGSTTTPGSTENRTPAQGDTQRSRRPTKTPLLESGSDQSVSESVEQHLNTGDFAKRAASLGDDIQRADLQREEHFKKTFSQKLGKLDDTSAEQAGSNAAANAETVASLGITAMLADRDNMRRAIVLHEILDRPEHLW